MERSVLIIDPFSTGRLYAEAFRRFGYRCCALISSRELPSHFLRDLAPKDFEEVFYWDSSIPSILQTLSLSAVVAGCETSIHLADHISELFQLPGNGAATSAVRRDKWLMQRALQRAGLAHIESRLVLTQHQVQGTLDALVDGSPFVVKPTNSAASDGVFLAKDKAHVREVLLNCAWNQRNDLGEINEGFVVQPFVSGTEYVVDLVSFGSRYIIASVCKYHKIRKNGRAFIYDSLEALDPFHPSVAALVDYARRAAKALNFAVGPIHMEIILSDKGPVMVEAGARLHGAQGPMLFEHTYQPTLMELAARSYLQSAPILRADSAKLIAHGIGGYLHSAHPRRFINPSKSTLERLRQVNSYKGHKFFFRAGEEVPPTVDLATCPGIFWLSNSDEVTLQKDLGRVRSLLWDST